MKAMHPNVSEYIALGRRAGEEQARGETAIAIGFLALAAGEIKQGLPLKTVVPCEGTGYEIGAMSLVKGARNADAAKRFHEWSLTPVFSGAGGQSGSYTIPSNVDTPLHRADATGCRDEVRAARPEEVRLEDRAQVAAHRALGSATCCREPASERRLDDRPRGGVAVVTGAASGIGARWRCSWRRGCHLALADVDGERLAEVADQARAQGAVSARAWTWRSPTRLARSCWPTCRRRTAAPASW